MTRPTLSYLASLTIAIAGAVLIPIASACAQAAPAAALVPAQSAITFTSKQMGVPVDGSFKRFDAKVALDPKNPSSGTVSLSVDLASVSLGTAELDTELAKPEWFDTKTSATAQFQSTSIAAAGPGKFDVAGKLTIKGHTQALTVPVTLTPGAGHSMATGQFTIKRLAYRIGDGDWADTSMVADDVIVKFKLALTGLPAL